MNDPKKGSSSKRNVKASSSSPSPKLHHRSQSEASRTSSSCRPSMERTNSPFARPSSSRGSSISSKGSSASSPSGSPKMKQKSSKTDVSKSEKKPEVLGTAGPSVDKEVKEEVKAEEVVQSGSIEKSETPDDVKSYPIALPETPEAPVVVKQVTSEAMPSTLETIPLPKVETVVSTVVDSSLTLQESQPIEAPEVAEQSSDSPNSASLTPADTDSGEDRSPTDTTPAQKSDASPSTASFTSSCSASPIRQDSVEDASLSEGAGQNQEQIVEQKAVQSRGKRGRASKKAHKDVRT